MLTKQTIYENRYSYLLMGGHLCVDMCQGAIAVILPYLVAGGYSYAQATMLIFSINIASAVVQPLMGWLGDRKPMPWLMALGVLLAGLGMAGVGVLGEYRLILLSAMVSGLGIAMLHPEGGRLANLVASHSKAGSMSIFSLGGQAGFCVGPIVAAAAMGVFGLTGALVFLPPCIVYALVLLRFNKQFLAFGMRDEKSVAANAGKDRWNVFALVLSSLSVRSVIYYAVTGFIPSFLIVNFALSEGNASLAVSIFALGSAVATAISAKVSSKTGTVPLMIACFALCAACFVVIGLALSLPVCLVLVVLLAFGVSLFNSPAITYAQSFVPRHLGMASGLNFGVAVCIGGVVSPVLGNLGDVAGLNAVMFAIAGIAAVGVFLSSCLLHPANRHASVQE